MKSRYLLCWIGIYLLQCLLMLPNFFGRWTAQGLPYLSSTDDAWLRTLKFSYVFFLLALFLTLFCALVRILNRSWISFLSFFLLALLACSEVIYRVIFGMVTDENFWQIVLGTSTYEKLSYLSGYGSWLAAIAILVLALSVVFAWLNRAVKTPKWFWKATGVTLLFMALFASGTSRFTVIRTPERFELSTEGVYEAAQFVFPFNLIFSMAEAKLKHEEMVKVRELRLAHRADVVKVKDGPEIVIVVIGESASASHWSMFGYARETTPLLSARKDIVSFSKAYSLAPATRQSVPLMLRLFTSENLDLDYTDTTLVGGFDQLGFQTHWISLQGASGPFDDTVRIISSEASEEHFLALASYHGKTFDEELLKFLPDLSKLSGKHVFFLHTLGSHVAYHHRYPESFRKFSPTLESDEWEKLLNRDPAYIQKLINGYDNSIRYTDFFLNEIIERLAKLERPSLFAYVSDHGQGLDGMDCKLIAHSSSCLQVFHVPMVFWESSSLRRTSPSKWAILSRNSSHETSSLSYAMTILDLAGATYSKRLDQYVLSERDNAGLPMPAIAGSKVVDLRVDKFDKD